MLNFYKSACIYITNESETLTTEKNISVAANSKVTISFYVPVVAAGIRIYRSYLSVDSEGDIVTGPNTETLLADIPLPDAIRKKPVNSTLFSFEDDGSLFISTASYPTTTLLTADEQKAIPVPDFTLTSSSGGFLAENTYYYRVSFYSVKDLAPVFSTKEMYIKFYTPNITEVMVYSRFDLTSEDGYSLISDPFAYVENIMDDLNFSGITLGVETLYDQQILVDGVIRHKTIYQQISVMISTENPIVLAKKPAILNITPSDVQIEVIENLLIGPTELFLGIISRVYNDPGSIVYFLSERAKFLFTLSGGSFKVVE